MFFFKRIVKIKRQLLGLENIFGYKTTTINQLYLLYCVFGTIFSTRDVHWPSKLFWLSWHFSAPIFGYVAGLFYLWYGDKQDFIMLLYNWFTVCLCTFICIVVPLVSHWYTRNIEAMFDVMDNILLERNLPGHRRSEMDIRKILANNLSVMLVAGIFYSSACIFDVLLFYEDEKVKNYMFYVIPLTHLEQFGSKTLLLTTSAIINAATVLPIIEVWTILKFFEIWAAACREKVAVISEELRICSKNLSTGTASIPNYYNNRKAMAQKMVLNSRFKKNLTPIIKAFQEVSRLIEIPRKYFQVISALIMIAAFISQMTHAYIFLATDLALSVRCKEMALFLFTAVLTFIVCRVGEDINNLVPMMSFEIYSTPWYELLPPFRKDILMLLSQIQREVNLKAMKVYPINVNIFLRLLNSIFSTTNVLARLMRK